MDKYKRLLSNTVLFGISVFSSKILVFLLMPFYTKILSPADSGIASQVIKSANLIIPIASIGIATAIIRFGLDKSYNKSDVFTTGLLAIGIGFTFTLCFLPFISHVPSLQGYIPLLYIFVLASIFRNLCSQFARAKLYLRLYAFDGILNTIIYVICMIVFLKYFKWGINGFILATIVADIITAIFIFTSASLHRYIKVTPKLKKTFIKMLKYAIPLIPTTMSWWIINTSDQYFVFYMCSSSDAGLYNAAYAIPHIVMMVSTLFTEAWQLSAVTDGGKEMRGRKRFYSTVFSNYQSVLFIIATGIIAFSKVAMIILTDKSYYEGWIFIPILVIAMVFSCFSTFMGSIYIVEKKSLSSLITLMVGAITNLILNGLFIPIMGPIGAAISTVISFVLVFVVRVIDTRKYLKMNTYPYKLIVNSILLILQTYIMLKEPSLWILYVGIILIIIVALNIQGLWKSVKKLLKK